MEVTSSNLVPPTVRLANGPTVTDATDALYARRTDAADAADAQGRTEESFKVGLSVACSLFTPVASVRLSLFSVT